MRAFYVFPPAGRTALAIVGVLAVALLIARTLDMPLVNLGRGLHAVDNVVSRALWRCEDWGPAWALAKLLTVSFTAMGIGVICGVFCLWGWRHGQRRQARFAGLVIRAGIVQSLLTETVKVIAGRYRPNDVPLLFDGIWRDIWDPFDGGNAFPSGHATFSFLFATIGAAYWPRYRRWWYAVAGAVAAARWVLLRHYASDIWAGACLGVWIGAVFVLSYPPLGEPAMAHLARARRRWTERLRARRR